MNRKEFILSAHCRLQVHCRLCRDREAGRAWRRGLGEHFVLPEGGPDFACPFGRPWGWLPPARGLGDTVERLFQVTGIERPAKDFIRRMTGRPCRCGEHRDDLNRLVPYSRREAGRPAPS